MMNMFKSNSGFRVMQLNDADSSICTGEIGGGNDGRGLVSLVNQQLL